MSFEIKRLSEENSAAVAEIEKLIDGNGRVLLRQSGTEPVIRIMIESTSIDLCEKYSDILSQVIKERGYCCD